VSALLQNKDLPSDYLDFMLTYDGGVGFVGTDENYLDLWNIRNIIDLDPYFSDDQLSKEIIVIGTNGSGTLYAYDLINKFFFESDEFEMTRENVINCDKSFLDFIKYLAAK
jgi:hypothetical protein